MDAPIAHRDSSVALAKSRTRGLVNALHGCLHRTILLQKGGCDPEDLIMAVSLAVGIARVHRHVTNVAMLMGGIAHGLRETVNLWAGNPHRKAMVMELMYLMRYPSNPAPRQRELGVFCMHGESETLANEIQFWYSMGQSSVQ